jgi:S-adenosylmethionine:tRNA ribosyltransferase-isomerase
LNQEYINSICISDFDYDLPKNQIAEYPMPNREDSKLLFVESSTGNMEHYNFSNIPDLLPKDSLLVLNVTKVISARLFMKKSTGGNAELLCVDPIYPSVDPQITMQAKGSCRWKCIIGGRKLIPGSTLTLRDDNSNDILKALIINRDENTAEIEFNWSPVNISFSEILSLYGVIPLPPYIKRNIEETDKNRYQTVFADYDGSVAAPTAGLHFTPNILEQIKSKNITTAEVTLHVGPGTFQPVETDFISEHKMHEERIIISKSVLLKLISQLSDSNSNKKIIATGTTSLRTLESLYWLGAQLNENDNNINLHLSQWTPYNFKTDITAQNALQNIVDHLTINNMHYFVASTSLFIVPGYEFKIAGGLITNFHLPKSTLLLLVSAFVGGELWKVIYKNALDNNFRFLSYGDSSLLMK